MRGNIVHTALEKFYKVDISGLDASNYKPIIAKHLRHEFTKAWTEKLTDLSKLGLLPQQLQFYHDESAGMLANWLNEFIKRLDKELNASSLEDAFKGLMPVEIEAQYRSEVLSVQGYIDCVHSEGGDIILIDYKTSKSSELKPEYKLQLGIYAALYKEKHGKLPSKVGLWFLKDKPLIIDVTEQLVKDALFEIEQIHFNTASALIVDYPKKTSPLCKWSSGQCDFYHTCMKDI
jgi:ATP-dependent exoDNAse (exonuclease V) beta subunit